MKEPSLREVAIGLNLLLQELVDDVSFIDEVANLSVSVLRGRRPGSYPATVSWRTDGVDLTLSPTELDMLAIFCLKAVCDGVAEVDHIDVEATQSKPGKVSFVFKFPVAVDPVGEEEARRRLGP